MADLAGTVFSPPVLSGYNRCPDTRFSRGTTRLTSWPDGERYLRPLQSLVVSLLPRIHSRLFSDWRRTVSSKFFDTQVPSISTEELVLPRQSRCVLSRLHGNGHSLLLGSYLSRIGRIKNPSCSACEHSPQDTSHLVLHCTATDSLRRLLFGDSVSLRLLVQTLKSCPASGAPWSPAMPPSLGRGRVTKTTLTRYPGAGHLCSNCQGPCCVETRYYKLAAKVYLHKYVFLFAAAVNRDVSRVVASSSRSFR